MPAFDNRIFKVIFTWGSDQAILDSTQQQGVWSPFVNLVAQGTKYINAQQNELSLAISNLGPNLRQQLLTQLTPFNYDQKRKSVQLFAGRESTGFFLLYQGDITECYPSQPPDITLNIKSQANAFWKYDILGQAQNLTAPLSQIVGNAANGLGLSPRFEATDKQIANYSYNGSRIQEINHIGELGPYDVYTDDTTLVCKNKGAPLQNTGSTISADTGMIGQPMPTEWGVRVTSLLTQSVILGGQFTVDSVINPLMNGDYAIYKLGFNIASREAPFYSLLEGTSHFDMYFNSGLPQS
jgi:hypothetical protein